MQFSFLLGFLFFLAWLVGLCREDLRWYSILVKSEVL